MKEFKIKYDYYQKKSDNIGFWIDYLRLSFKNHKFSIFDYIPEWIDNDNTNLAYINIWDIKLSVSCVNKWDSNNSYMFSVSYNDNSVSLFFYRLYHERHLIDFYGSFFRLIEIEFLPSDFIDKILYYFRLSFEYINISRIDYRLDFFMNTPSKILHYNDLLDYNINSNNVRVWKKGNTLTNWQVWDKNSKALSIRLYDKLLDTRKKWKDFLYFDYFRYNTVHRLEFECWLKFCHGYTYKNLDKLLDKILSVFWLNNDKWKWCVFYRYNRDMIYYNRFEIDRYLSYIRKALIKLDDNYKSYCLHYSWNSVISPSDYWSELNPLNICIDYLISNNKDNLEYVMDILFNSYNHYSDRIDYVKKTYLLDIWNNINISSLSEIKAEITPKNM